MSGVFAFPGLIGPGLIEALELALMMRSRRFPGLIGPGLIEASGPWRRMKPPASSFPGLIGPGLIEATVP